eukprot:COSAG02_NODE_5752_length_4065_cov_2.444781_2_plen_118_part_00
MKFGSGERDDGVIDNDKTILRGWVHDLRRIDRTDLHGCSRYIVEVAAIHHALLRSLCELHGRRAKMHEGAGLEHDVCRPTKRQVARGHDLSLVLRAVLVALFPSHQAGATVSNQSFY